MNQSPIRHVVVIGVACALAACGASSGSGGSPPVISNPPPPPPPPPAPPPDPEGPIGLVSNEPFAVLGISTSYAGADTSNAQFSPHEKAEVSLRYRGSDGAYVISIPGYNPGTLATRGYEGSWSNSSAWLSVYGTLNELLDGESGRQDAVVSLRWPSGPLNPSNDLQYTSWGSWGDDPTLNGKAAAGTIGTFAYGIPTPQAEIPTTGSATYQAEIIGETDQAYPDSLYRDYIAGTAELRFDFAAGLLSGEMNPLICPWECTSLGTYTFAETVYATGSTTFSGKFSKDGEVIPSWFEGSFNGPNAAELMARWSAKYDYDGGSFTMGGIWVGKQSTNGTSGR